MRIALRYRRAWRGMVAIVLVGPTHALAQATPPAPAKRTQPRVDSRVAPILAPTRARAHAVGASFGVSDAAD